MKEEIIEQFIKYQTIHNKKDQDDVKKEIYSGEKIKFDRFQGSEGIVVLVHPQCANQVVGKPLHSHDFFEMIYLYRGGAVQYMIERNIELQEGTVGLMNPDCFHGISTKTEDGIIFNILFSKEMVSHILMHAIEGNELFVPFFFQSLFQKDEQPRFIYFDRNIDSKMEYFMQSLIKEYVMRNSGYLSNMRAYLTLIFTELLRSHISHFQNSQENNTIAQMLQYVKEHLKSISLQDVGNHFHYSPNYLSKYFVQNFGCTFSKLVSELRLQEAANLLTLSGMSINEIVEECGYYDRSYFNKAFGKKYHMTPSKFQTLQMLHTIDN